MAISNLNADGNPIMFDGTIAAATKVIEPEDTSLFVKFIYWYNPTAQGHLLILETAKAREIITMRCETANESQWAPVWSRFPDIYCSDLDSGKVYIYTR